MLLLNLEKVWPTTHKVTLLPFFSSISSPHSPLAAAEGLRPVVATLNKLEVSASSICNDQRELYDIFSLPLSSECYLPNQRLRDLLSSYQTQPLDEAIVRVYEYEYQKLPLPHSWQFPKGGSETGFNDPVLHSYLTTIQREIIRQTDDRCPVCLQKDATTMPSFLAGTGSRPEYRITHHDEILIASEAKGIQNSHYVGSVQGMHLAGDSAIYLNKFLHFQDCVVPVVLAYGSFLHIFAVYLIKGNFPVMVALSEPISYLTEVGRLSLARWTVVLSSFAIQTTTLRSQSSQEKCIRAVELSLDEYFFKPILNLPVDSVIDKDYSQKGSCRQTCLESMMQKYKRLSAVSNSAEYFLFPAGTMSYPSSQNNFYESIKDHLKQFFTKYFSPKLGCIETGCPVAVFPLLDDTWGNEKPPRELISSYQEKVSVAVRMLNEARVAHCDLRPSNIMWRRKCDTTVAIQVIDFEDSVSFDAFFHPYEKIRYDLRYPFYQQNDYVKISSFHNFWFLAAIEQWLQSDVSHFGDFMNQRGIYGATESAANLKMTEFMASGAEADNSEWSKKRRFSEVGPCTT